MSFNNNKNESHLDKQLHRNTQTKVHPSLHHAKIYNMSLYINQQHMFH
jgi:hypothetical protein